MSELIREYASLKFLLLKCMGAKNIENNFFFGFVDNNNTKSFDEILPKLTSKAVVVRNCYIHGQVEYLLYLIM